MHDRLSRWRPVRSGRARKARQPPHGWQEAARAPREKVGAMLDVILALDFANSFNRHPPSCILAFLAGREMLNKFDATARTDIGRHRHPIGYAGSRRRVG